MTPVTYYTDAEYTSPKFAYAFARGCGGQISDDLDYLHHGPVALFGSPPVWPLLRRAQADGREFWYGDHAYFGRRQFYRVTKNGYQHDGRGDASQERFSAFSKPVQPWRTSGEHILLCPNSAIYFQLHGLDADQWLTSVKAHLRAHTDRPIRTRWKRQAQSSHIAQDLAGAWAVVVYSSAAAIDALIAGVPVFTLAPFAATARMGLSDLTQIERPYYPDDREPFLWNLAANQWTLSEMVQGEAWRTLQEVESRAA